MSPAERLIAEFSDEDLIAAVAENDRYRLPVERRFAGDTPIIDALMQELELPGMIVNKLLIASLVFREALVRGLQIPRQVN